MKLGKGVEQLQKDIHYYAILTFARNCGFSKKSAYIVAYALQLDVAVKWKCRKVRRSDGRNAVITPPNIFEFLLSAG